MENLIIRNFREKLLKTINEEPIQIEIKRLVLKEVAELVASAADKKIENELAELESRRARKGEKERESAKAMPEDKKGEKEKCQESRSDKKS